MLSMRAMTGARMRLSAGLRVTAVGAVLLIALALPGSVRANETVWTCGGNTSTGVFGHAAVFGINTLGICPAGPALNGWGLEISTAGNTVANGQRAHWQATTPAGLVIVGASIPMDDLSSTGVDDGQQYGGGFYWSGGGANVNDTETSASGVSAF